jgi:hypothetical protein
MPSTKRLGFICTCGRQVRLGGGGIETANELAAWRDKKRQEHWAVMVVRSEAAGGCGHATSLQADDVILVDVPSGESGEGHP